MVNKRILARLDLKGSLVVKGYQLEGLKPVGSVKQLSQNYYESGVDELVLIDVVASLYEQSVELEAIHTATDGIFIPITVGGGIRSLKDVRALFSAGADRVLINSHAFKDLSLLRRIAEIYGAQAVVLSIEARKLRNNTWYCFTESGRENSGVDINTWLSKLKRDEVGEILITSIDQDGTKLGPDLDLIDFVTNSTNIPIVYSGGVDSIESAAKVLHMGGVSGVAIGAAFHDLSIYPISLKKFLKDSGIGVPI